MPEIRQFDNRGKICRLPQAQGPGGGGRDGVRISLRPHKRRERLEAGLGGETEKLRNGAAGQGSHGDGPAGRPVQIGQDIDRAVG